jgi:hypothetical protein
LATIRAWTVATTLAAPWALGTAGCKGAFDEMRLGMREEEDPSQDGSGQAGSGPARDGGLPGPGPGPGPVGGSGGPAIDAGPDPGDVDSSPCEPNPDATATDCPEICRERCNREDDDCDGQTDEGLSCEDGDDCDVDHGAGVVNDGECLIALCDDGYRDCDGDPDTGCEIGPTDPDHCGGCDQRCELAHASARCDDGECVIDECDALYDDCDDNPDDCETRVTSLESCTGCGVACDDLVNASATCDTGSCEVASCRLGYDDCNEESDDGCEQELATNSHCGGCRTDCDHPGSIDDCSSGVCLAAGCESGWDECNDNLADGCESLSTADYCGSCGRRCDASLPNALGGECVDQECTLQCAPGLGDCNDDEDADGCETMLDSVQQCGACDRSCAEANAVMDCVDGDCVFVRCESGFGDCNDDVELDGCEASIATDTRCGSCTNDCTVTTDPVCSGGVCSDVTCAPDLADCNQDGFPCEVNLTDTLAHCGACGAACAFTAGDPNAGNLRCENRACEITCEAGYDDCNGDYRDGCETSLTTLSDCGGCDDGCAIANASATCATQSCRVSACATDWDDCNDDGISCETPLDTNANCGGCGVNCARPNALTACVGTPGARSCTVTGCGSTNYDDCDGNPENGCEIDKRSALADCGACDNDCTALPHVDAPSCTDSLCVFGCDPGYGNCTAAPGCETQLNTNTHCAACGTACARTGGVASCSSGSCELVSCNPGFDDCNDDPDDGCEPLTTLANCGGCGDACTIVNGTGSCSTGSCAVATCAAGWADCDGVASNGCERNTLPPASGGLGPCLPDTGCVQGLYEGRPYYACPTARTWSDARSRCQLQLLGDLLHVDAAAENGFARSLAGTANVWIGATDAAVEGSWLWSNDGTQFWLGASGGSASAYAQWNGGEPNNQNNEDCAEMYASGAWNDAVCTLTRGFICEVQADLCPSDPLKANPGQCGCGVADSDGDGDGTANCHDECPLDPAKVEPGVCDCGTPDTNTDGDALADCDDGCPLDAAKTAPGLCMCGVADTNTDGDAQPDCLDACPFDGTKTIAPCGFPYDPSNIDETMISFGGAPDTTLDCGTSVTIHTSDPITITGWCGTQPTPVVMPQNAAGATPVAVIPLQGLRVPSTTTIRITGSRPLVFAVQGDASLAGTLDARGLGAVDGAGGHTSCSTSGTGGAGVNGGSSTFGGGSGGGGGGGGGMATVGAAGGIGSAGGAGGGGGAIGGNATATPLRGGCRGGRGGNGNNSGGAGGGAGGAIQLTVSGTLTVASTAVISVSGGGGRAGVTDEDAGGGGGSAGMVLLEASQLAVNGGFMTANGGGGASGAETDSASSRPGADGLSNSPNRAAGGGADYGAGDGGWGAAQQGAATPGGDGFAKYLGWGFGSAGGGGGGSVGFIRLRGAAACSLNAAANYSPASPSTACP